MFMQTGSEKHEENVCWLVQAQQTNCMGRYKSLFASKVRWDNWMAKNGCCRTIGPPPNICSSCPEHFLKKHSRQVPVFFPPEDLKVNKADILKATQRAASLDTGLNLKPDKAKTCRYPSPPSLMGLFRGPGEQSYEKKYGQKKRTDCLCDEEMMDELLEATKCAGAMAAELEKQEKINAQAPPKDHIRANALNAIRMPARRTRRCYVDKCGIHLIDMSDSPYVLCPGFGKVPPYLYRRKMELLRNDIKYKQQLKQQANSELEEVADQEREMVIQGLKEYWGDLLRQYNSQPMSQLDNERNREVRASLEARMKEVEADLKLLTSTTSLFVGNVKASHYL